MHISIVVAASENKVIGVDNQLPWHLPDDLKFFKKSTLSKPVLMGKNTWLSLGKALPGRLNVVLSSTLTNLPEGVLQFSDIDEALTYLRSQEPEEVCIIGGGAVYRSSLKYCDTVLLTRVHTIIEHGAAFFPDLDDSEWTLEWEEHHDADEKHVYSFTFQKWVRK